MKQIDAIKFNFYVPIYGSGYFLCEKSTSKNATIMSFLGVPEGTCDIIEDETTLPLETFDCIRKYCYSKLNSDISGDINSWDCSVDFISNEEIIEEFGDGKLDYDNFTEVLYHVVNTYAEDLSQYLW